MSKVIAGELSYLGRRSSFNATLRHIVNTSNLVESVEKGANPADLINSMILRGALQREQIPAIVSLILGDRLGLPFEAYNLPQDVSNFKAIVETFQRWNAVDLTCVYHHPNFGIVLINPARENHWNDIYSLKKNELIVIYGHSKKGKREKAHKAVMALCNMLIGGHVEEDADFIGPAQLHQPLQKNQGNQGDRKGASIASIEAKGGEAPGNRPPINQPSQGGKMRLTPRYSIQVTNELFHNGNVEAWKNIIESYQEAHQGCRVVVYHEGELIQDLNALFKWGKVKHGGLIFFQVAGSYIKNVSRLQKYLLEAASPRFDAFMKRDVNKSLALF